MVQFSPHCPPAGTQNGLHLVGWLMLLAYLQLHQHPTACLLGALFQGPGLYPAPDITHPNFTASTAALSWLWTPGSTEGGHY